MSSMPPSHMSRLLPQNGPSSLPYPPYQPSTARLSTSYTTSLTSLRPLALQVIPAAVAGSDAWVVWSRRLLGAKDALYPPADPPSFFLSLPPASSSSSPSPSLSHDVRLINTAVLLSHLAPSDTTNVLSAQSPTAVLFLAQVKDLYLILSNLRPRSALLWLAQDLLIELCTVLCALLKVLHPETTGPETYALVFFPTLFKHPELVCGALQGALVPRDVGVLEKMWVKEAARRVRLLGREDSTPDLPTSLSTLRSKLLQDLTKNLVPLLRLADVPPTTALPIPLPPPAPAPRPRQFAADVLVPPRSSNAKPAEQRSPPASASIPIPGAEQRSRPAVPKGFVFNAPQADAVRLEETQMSFMEDGSASSSEEEEEEGEGERAEKDVGSEDPEERKGGTGGGKGKGAGRAGQKSVRPAEQDDRAEPSVSAEDELEEVEDALQVRVRGATSPPPPRPLPAPITSNKAKGKSTARADPFEDDAGPVAPSRPVKPLPHTSPTKHRAEPSRLPSRALPPQTPPHPHPPNGKKRARSESQSESDPGSPRKRRATSVVPPNTAERARELLEDVRRGKRVDVYEALGVLAESLSPGASASPGRRRGEAGGGKVLPDRGRGSSQAYRSPRGEAGGGRLRGSSARNANGVSRRRAAEEEEEASASPDHGTSPSDGRFKRALEQAGSSSRAANGVGRRAPVPGPSRTANGVGARSAAEEDEEKEEEEATPDRSPNHWASPSDGRSKRPVRGLSSRTANGVGRRAAVPGGSRIANGVGARSAAGDEVEEEEEEEGRSMEVGSSRRRDRDREERVAGSEDEYEAELSDEDEDELTDDAPYRPSLLPKRERTHPSPSASASPQTRNRYRTGHNLTGRQSWTPREDAILEESLHELYRLFIAKEYKGTRKWTDVLKMHGPKGTKSKGLKDRNNVQLRDRARNLVKLYERMGKKVPAYLKDRWDAEGGGGGGFTA